MDKNNFTEMVWANWQKTTYIGDRKLDRDSHSHSRNNLIGRTCENVIHEWILSKRRGSLVTDLLSKKRELFHTCYL